MLKHKNLNIIKKVVKTTYYSPLAKKNFKFKTLNKFLPVCYFSTSSDLHKHYFEFNQWFVGFSDGESNFSIVPKLDNNGIKINRFTFMFVISLHIDDLNVLMYIKTELGIGNVSVNNNECKFVVTDKIGINKLIYIFEKHNLNSSKYLDYFDFRKAFKLYHGREGILTEQLKSKILELKNNMNTNRNKFNMPIAHKVVIRKSWFLGLIEGEGSFHLWRKDLIPIFSLVLTETQLPLLIKIKEFLENNLGFDKYSMHKLKCSSFIAIRPQNARNNSKASVLLIIKSTHILHNFLIPFFQDIEFKTKKAKDFIDFKIICKAIYGGAHKRDEIKSLILKLSYTMKNFRLSTCSYSAKFLSINEIDMLINAAPTIEHLKDGRQKDILTDKMVHQNTSSIYEILKPNGETLILKTLSKTAKIIGVNVKTLSKHLDVYSNDYTAALNSYKIKRIPVFYPQNKK